VSGRYLLDTNVIIDLLVNDEMVKTRLAEADDSSFGTSVRVITLSLL